MSLSLFLALRASAAQDDVESRVAELVRTLRADAIEVRDDAQRKLEALGTSAGPAIQRAFKDATDLEVRRRLDAVLDFYLLLREEAFVSELMKKPPHIPEARGIEPGEITSVAEFLAAMRVAPFEGDRVLESRIAAASFSLDLSKSVNIETMAAGCLDGFLLATPDRVVIVRLTPASFWAVMDPDAAIAKTDWIERALRRHEEAENGRAVDWRSNPDRLLEYVRSRLVLGDRRWVELMLSTVKDATAPADRRLTALRALERLDPAPTVPDKGWVDLESMYEDLVKDEKAPETIRATALVRTFSNGRAEIGAAILRALESGGTGIRQALLCECAEEAAGLWLSGHRSRVMRDEAFCKDLAKRLDPMANSENADLAAQARALTALMENDAKLADARPEGRGAVLNVLLATAVTGPDGSARERFRDHADPVVRAAYQWTNMGPRADGPKAIEDAFKGIEDEDALVRLLAAGGLRTMIQGKLGTKQRDALEAALGKEECAGVKWALGRLLRQDP